MTSWLFSPSCKTEQNPVSLLLPSHPEFVSHEGARASQPFLCVTHAHMTTDYQSQTPRMRLDLRTTGNTPLHLEGLWERGKLVGARGLSFCTPESLTLLFTCPSLHKTTHSHEDPPPSLIFFISLLNGHRPRPYLSREAGPGLLHISFMLGCHFARPLFHQGPAPCSLTFLCHWHVSRNTAAVLSASGCFFLGGS